MIKCPLPWTGINVDPDGSVKNCGISRHSLGNIERNTITEILNGSINQDIRNSFTQGQWPASCKGCADVEAIDPEYSNRTFHINLHKDVDQSFYSSNEHQLKQLDLRWSNTCNYACVYCSPALSSQWATELGRRVNTDRSNLASLKEYVFANLTDLVEVHLAGGEPLLIKENLELLDELYIKNPTVNIRITTNLSNLNTGVYKKLQQFENVEWVVSVEAIGDQFEYIRYPGIWSEFESNLVRLLKEYKNDLIKITMNYFLLNTNTIIETGKHLIDLGVGEQHIAAHTLTGPGYLDARNLNDTSKQLAIEYLRNYHDPYTTLGNSLNNCAEFLTKSIDRNPAFVIQSLQQLDQRRNQNFEKTFPNLTNMIL